MSFTPPPTYPPLLFLYKSLWSVECRVVHIIHNSIGVLELLKREEEELMKVEKVKRQL